MGYVDLAAETSVQEAIEKIKAAGQGIDEIKTALAQIERAMNVFHVPVYGFIEHMAILDPAQRIEYIEANKDFTPANMNFATGALNYGSWNDFWFLRANRPAMVKFDGTLDYWLDPDDYTKKEDGTASDVANTDYAGGAYAWIPKIYKCEYVIGDDRYVYFSQQKVNDDFIPAGFVDEDGNELPGVWLPMFYGVVDANGKMRTLATGNPSAGSGGRNTETQRAAIDACGARHKFLGGAIMCTLADLLVMFVRNTNSQASYGNGAMSSYDAALPNYGALDNAVVGGGQFYGTTDGKSLNKMLHSIVLASQSVWLRDPYTITVESVFYVSKDYHYDVTGATYINTGIKISADGYITKMEVAPGFGALPVKPGGTSATGDCDGFYANSRGIRCCLRLGGCSVGLTGGLFSLYGVNDASYSWWNIGAAPLLLPPAV